jgi:hypothetical protein
MIPYLFFYQLAVRGLLWLFCMLSMPWPSRCALREQRPAKLNKPPRKCSNEPTPFPGLTHKPHCALCAHEATSSVPSKTANSARPKPSSA